MFKSACPFCLTMPAILVLNALAAILPLPIPLVPMVPNVVAGALELSPCGYGGGGRFTSIAVDGQDGSQVLIGSDVAGIYRSTDGGATFSLRGENLEGFAVADIWIHPSNPQAVLMLTVDGLYVSKDRGNTWTKKTSAVRYESRFFGSRLSTTLQDSLYVASDPGGVFVLKGDPTTSSEFQPVPPPENVTIRCMVTAQNAVHIGTSKGVFKLDQKQWTPLNEGLPAAQRDVMDMGVSEGGALYLVERQTGLWALNLAGTGWDRRQAPSFDAPAGGAAFKALAVHPKNPAVVFMATHPESWPYLLFKSSDGGQTWKKLENYTLSESAAPNWTKSLEAVEQIVFSPKDPKVLFVSDWWNVWKSDDEGEQWKQVHQGLQNTVINDVKVHPEKHERIYAAAADNGLMVSDDGGLHWKRKMAGIKEGHGQEIEISRQDTSRLFLLMNPWKRDGKFHVYKSTNGGENWTFIGFPIPSPPLPKLGYVDGLASSLELDPTNDQVIYVGTNGYGVFKTTNGGASWQAVNFGLDTPYLKGSQSLLVHPTKPQVLFASTQQGGVFRTANGGATWSGGTPKYPFTFGIAMDPLNPSRLIAACGNKKVIRSEDEGRTWKEVQLPGPAPPHIAANAVAFSTSQPQVVIVGTLGYDLKAADGLFLSSDGGQSFEKKPQALPQVNINCITAYPGGDPQVLVGFNGIGVFRGGLR